MAKLNTKENIENVRPKKLQDVYMTQVMTGGDDKQKQLYYQIIYSLKKAKCVDIVVSFLMESGVKMILKELEKAVKRGVKIRILTGNYLGITQPSALYLIKQHLGTQVDLRFYNEKNRSFHPKSYIFHYQDYSEIYIGSSNISKSALTSGIEWNYRFTNKVDISNYNEFYDSFEDLFENHSIIIDDEELKKYTKSWRSPSVMIDLESYDAEEENIKLGTLFEPRGAQIEALCALENTRNEGAKRGLVQAATGIGKTYLSAFDSKEYKTVLFIAHREEILKQAANSFRNIRGNDTQGFFDGNEKTTNAQLIFASVATLGNSEYLNAKYFKEDYFDYIIVDEFHHAVTKQYRNIIDYFKPKFMLGLTATPDRMDGRNIYEICDYNICYEISTKDAINRGMLVPFRYYGIFDDTDYSGLRVLGDRYDVEELNQVYICNTKRYDLILKNYSKYGSKCALGFCCSKKHAEAMAKEFNRNGIPSVSVYSGGGGEYSMDRKLAISKLKLGEIRVIFSVDMFNEGVDITEIDMVLFLRPTESPTVFLQQLGRGLRKSKGKDHLKVLDFIGNYKKAGRVRFFLTEKSENERKYYDPADQSDFPDNCQIDFDLRLIDLFKEMDRKSAKIKERLEDEFKNVKEKLKRTPTRLELYTYMDNEVYEKIINHSKLNPFKRYISYLEEKGEAPVKTQETCSGLVREFIGILETTSMTKVYKMPVIMAFYNKGKIRMRVTEEELLESWKEFFNTGSNWKDVGTNLTYEEYSSISDKKHLNNIMKNPVHFLQESGQGFFIRGEGMALGLREELKEVIKEEWFVEQMRDIIEYRTMDYYQRRIRQ